MFLRIQKALFFVCFLAIACAEENPKHFRVSARYTTPQGIGYNQGYTTVEGFFSPLFLKDTWLPFLDLRGHVFDNGRLAGNVGTGLRYLSESRVWGGYLFYDYRNTHEQKYNQGSLGLETLGRIWDFRINGYLPWGKKEVVYHPEFYAFQGHSMIVKYSQQFSMKGANAEAGFHLDKIKHVPFYFAAGPYYLTGKGKTTWGGALRASCKLYEYVQLEVDTGYDHFFKWTGQGQISLNFSFGKRSPVHKGKNRSCAQAETLATRALQRVDRNEIIPVGTRKHLLTASSLYFIFVDNTSSSLGTYESPYPTLQEAQFASVPNSIIYVFPGNGNSYNTAYGTTNGMTLQNAQRLLGASTTHGFNTPLGLVTIPPQASTLPIVTNTNLASSFSIITLANSNDVSGFQLNNTSSGSDICHCISGSGISNVTATQNTFTGGVGTSSPLPVGINLSDVSGQVTIDFSTFNDVGSGLGHGILATFGTSNATTTMNVSNSTFNCATIDDIGESSSLHITHGDLGNSTLNIANITVSGFQTGIRVTHGTLNAGGNNTFTLNMLDSSVSGALEPGVYIENANDYGLLTANVTRSSIHNNGTDGLRLLNNGNFTAPFHFTSIDSQFNDNATIATGTVNNGAGVSLQNGNGPCELTLIRSQANGNGSSTGVTIDPNCHGMKVLNFLEAVTVNISDCQFNGNGVPSAGTVKGAFGLGIYNDSAATEAITVSLLRSQLNGNGVANGGIVEGATNAGLIVNDTSATAGITVSNMSGTTFNNNDVYGIYGTATDLGTTTINYSGATFSGSETTTNQQVPGNNVNWIQ